MIYIFVALTHEARPLIRCLDLKKADGFPHFSVWTSPEKNLLLTVTGSGPVSAAVASAAVFALRPPGPADHILNTGICAGLENAQKDTCYLCSSITETDTGRVFYPDLLWRHSFPEAALCTGSRVLSDPDDPALTGFMRGTVPLLYDMEAAAIYQSAAIYAGPHQMSFLKTVSDCGDGTFPTPQDVSALMENSLSAILSYLDALPDAADEEPSLSLFPQLSRDLHCSVSMQHMLRQYLHYAELTGCPYQESIARMYEDGLLPCKDRKEGKKILEQIRSILL